ncbi:hypothetical protein G3N56_16300 [Desulfovibrio sulfodismutans]|uniref:Uncharacterized protein n=1 Tax=Desulfolutivibrio sulfodismutans TaxID=63561 RepID=A0A7K3NR74_9BACT|nr:hypothetical protein [Desulfolutivibrio sulfodismutans]NDY58295.1 hypothetical protein [Desulfolutivibrio sulfodismutans]QLA12638.1 hypothetical protein GD606_10320 [Desulfolutivibrio sulfodismutans DSM 3696]
MESTFTTHLAPAFSPPLQPLCTIAPARYKAFVGLTRQLVELHGPRPIYADNSRIVQAIGTPHFWVDIDLANILLPAKKSIPVGVQPVGTSDPGVSFGFLASAKDIDNLASLAGKSEIEIHDLGTELVFTNGYTKAQLTKPTPQEPTASVTLPSEKDKLGEEVEVDDLDAIKRYVAKTRFVFLMCFSRQFEQVEIRGKNPYYLHKPSFTSLADRSPDLMLTSSNFLALAGKLGLSFGVYRNVHGYWLRTSSKPNMINNLTTYELLYEGRV